MLLKDALRNLLTYRRIRESDSRRTAELMWGEIATDKFRFDRQRDKKVAVSPPRPMTCSAARYDKTNYFQESDYNSFNELKNLFLVSSVALPTSSLSTAIKMLMLMPLLTRT